MPTTTLKQLEPHPAQMRTTYDLDALAALTLQVRRRGLDDWQPIVASPNGDGYHIVSGHRRHMARLFALALAADGDNEPPTVQRVGAWLSELVARHGDLETAVAALLATHGDHEVAFALFEGGEKAQILALQAANYGSDQPDMLGVAHSFRQALAAGASPEELAGNVGQSVTYVRNHLALAEIPAALAERIAAGELPLSVAPAVADLPQPKRSGLSVFILANPSAGSGQAAGKLTAKAVKACAAALKQWPGLQQPLLVRHQSQRNVARALVRLWSQALEAYPEDAYAAAAMFIYRGVHEEPWAVQEKLALWFQVLGGETYFQNGRIHWPAVTAYLLPEVACASCPIAQLPRETLGTDLSQGQGGPLGMPCRVGGTAPSADSGQASRCLHGLAAGDPFDVRVPWEWSSHPGVVGDGGDYRVKSYDDLLAAWQAQRAAEAAARAETGADAETPAADGAAAPDPADSVVSAPAAGAPSPIARQRAKIAAFMRDHEQMAARHPFATSCAGCRHRLDASPTKDETVPHCAWAGRLRTVAFRVLAADDGQAARVPVCRQYAPAAPWAELIPAHPQPSGLPRAWVQARIIDLAEAASSRRNTGNAFEFLTGRPMRGSESYGDWFGQQLAAQAGDLSDAQLFTLFVWAHTEWERAQGRSFRLPVDGKGVQFAGYAERPWPQKTEGE